MKPDPPRRKDGRCAQPGCTNRLPKMTARHRRYGGSSLDFEPFCSRECAEAWHGTKHMGSKP